MAGLRRYCVVVETVIRVHSRFDFLFGYLSKLDFNLDPYFSTRTHFKKIKLIKMWNSEKLAKKKMFSSSNNPIQTSADKYLK